MKQLSIIALADRIVTEADAYLLLEELRWNGAPVCSHCGSERVFYLNPTNGTSRKTRTGANSERRVWKCGACRKQFSVLTGTIFHGTKISLRKWLFVIFEICANNKGLAAREIERKYQLTAKTAWFMTHRIREAMKQEPLIRLLSGTIEADETWVVGKVKNPHQQGKVRPKTGRGTAGYPKDKTAVLSLVNTTTGEVRSRVIADINGTTLREALVDQIDTATSTLHTEAAPNYREVGRKFGGGTSGSITVVTST